MWLCGNRRRYTAEITTSVTVLNWLNLDFVRAVLQFAELNLTNQIFFYVAQQIDCTAPDVKYNLNQRRLTMSLNSLPVTTGMPACLDTNCSLFQRTQYRRKEETP